MKLTQSKQFIEYFRTNTDPSNKRRALRLPVRLPLLYSFVSRADRFHECQATDVSRDGICVELKDLYPGVKKQYLKKDSQVYFKLELPSRPRIARPGIARSVIDITARIRWIYPEEPDLPATRKVGCEFDGLSIEHRAEILQVGLSQIRKRRLLAVLTALFALVLTASVVWLAAATASEKQTQTMLKDSEFRRLALLGEKENLGKDVEALKQDLARNYRNLANQRATLLSLDRRIRSQTLVLKERDDSLQEQERRIAADDSAIMEKMSVISQRSREIDDLSKLLDQKTAFLKSVQEMLGEIGEEWNMGTSERLIILDQSYAEGRDSLLAKDYPKACAAFRSVVKRYPDSLLGYRLLYRSLVLAGEKFEAEQVFTQYMKQTRKILDRTR